MQPNIYTLSVQRAHWFVGKALAKERTDSVPQVGVQQLYSLLYWPSLVSALKYSVHTRLVAERKLLHTPRSYGVLLGCGCLIIPSSHLLATGLVSRTRKTDCVQCT